MPGYIRKVFPDKPPEFAKWLWPREISAMALLAPNIPMAKILLFHCLADNSRTLVCEREVPVETAQTKASRDAFVKRFLKEVDPKNPDKVVERDNLEGVLVSIGDEDTGTAGFLIHHTPFVELDMLKPRELALMAEHIRNHRPKN
jgi:hypothetical protein